MNLSATRRPGAQRTEFSTLWAPIEVDLIDWVDQQRSALLPDDDYPHELSRHRFTG
jgi:hypothetical protein